MAAKSTTNNNTPDKVDFSWTDDEIQLLLESAVAYKSQMEYQGLAWEGVRSKYDKIKEIMVERYPKDKEASGTGSDTNVNKKFPDCSLIISKRIAAKMKKIRQDFRRAVDSGRQSGGGRVVYTFFPICQSLWGGSPDVTSLEGFGIASGAKQSSLADTVGPDGDIPPAADLSADNTPSGGTAVKVSEEEENPAKERRLKIMEQLKDRKDKKINQKLSVDAQLLNVAKEELTLKRKLFESFEKDDTEFKEGMAKMSKTMESIGVSIQQGFGLLANLLNLPKQPSYMQPHNNQFPQTVQPPLTEPQYMYLSQYPTSSAVCTNPFPEEHNF